MRNVTDRRRRHLQAARLAKERLRCAEWTHDLVEACNALADQWLLTGPGRKVDGLRSQPPACEIAASHLPITALPCRVALGG